MYRAGLLHDSTTPPPHRPRPLHSPVTILAGAQLRLDLRHPRTRRFAASRVGMTALAYGFSGLLLAVSVGGGSSEAMMFVGGSFGMVLAAFGVAGSYDELMGRPKENRWLMTLPATEHQFYAARLVGLAFYFVLMALAVALPIGVYVGLYHGASAGVSVASLVASGMLWTAAAAMAALWATTLLLPPTALRWAVGGARTILIAALVLGYQWIGADSSAADASWWPAAWMADALRGRTTLGLSVLVGSTGLLVGAYAGIFPSRYFRLIDRMASAEARAERKARGRQGLSGLESILLVGPASRAAYGFARAAFRDDRLVRGRLWPAAALPLGFAVFGAVTGGLESLFVHGPENAIVMEDTRLHLSLLVVLLFACQSLVQTLQFSDHAEASWVFGTLPGARPRVLQLGAQQALAYRVLLPLHIALGLALAVRMPAMDAAIHATFWYAVALLASRIHALCYSRPPFSRPADRYSAAERFGPLVGSIPGALAVLVIQAVTFTVPWLAITAIIGLLAISAALGLMVTLNPDPLRPATALGTLAGGRVMAAPVPARDATR
jgi:hypothetical protein